jgi:hypothetical protein
MVMSGAAGMFVAATSRAASVCGGISRARSMFVCVLKAGHVGSLFANSRAANIRCDVN